MKLGYETEIRLCTCIILLIMPLLFLSQMGAVEISFDEVQNLFDIGGAKGLSRDSVEKIPKITITSDNNVHASGEKDSCSVCLQVFYDDTIFLFLFLPVNVIFLLEY